MPGDQWTRPGIFNPSYFAPNQYRDFARATGDVEGWKVRHSAEPLVA